MRQEDIERASPVIIVHGETIEKCGDLNNIPQSRLETEIKQQERHAVKSILDNSTIGDGYFISLDTVYKVYRGNGLVKKITGDEAKTVKRRVKEWSVECTSS